MLSASAANFPILARTSPRVPLTQYMTEDTVVRPAVAGTDAAVEDAVMTCVPNARRRVLPKPKKTE